VFRCPWTDNVDININLDDNPSASITNLNLEQTALVLLFLVIKAVAGILYDMHVTLYSYNSPSISIHSVQCMVTKNSPAAMQLGRALSICLLVIKASPLTAHHIVGTQNIIMDMPSSSFGSKA
jgi:hypothetical protein